ncbi:MAG: hypothetical protein AAFY32_04820, partial [Pseudomonadota bacterium]
DTASRRPGVNGDDAFDEEPRFGGRAGRLDRRFAALPRTQLPAVDLPQTDFASGNVGALAGASGIIAIFCGQQFADPDKVAECAGRVQILSGWQPGDSGEDYSRAVKILRQAQRERGGSGPVARELSLIVGPREARLIQSLERAVEITNKAQTSIADSIDPTSESIASGTSGLDLGPGPLGPRPVRNDPIITDKQLRDFERTQAEIERVRREAERAARRKKDDDGE